MVLVSSGFDAVEGHPTPLGGYNLSAKCKSGLHTARGRARSRRFHGQLCSASRASFLVTTEGNSPFYVSPKAGQCWQPQEQRAGSRPSGPGGPRPGGRARAQLGARPARRSPPGARFPVLLRVDAALLFPLFPDVVPRSGGETDPKIHGEERAKNRFTSESEGRRETGPDYVPTSEGWH